MGTMKAINPKREPLTIEKLRSFEGLENLTDEEAQEIIFSLVQLASITFELFKELKEDEQNTETKLKLAA